MKKGFLALVTLVLMIGLIGCSNSETTTAETTIKQTSQGGIADDGVLTVAMNANFPPFEYHEVVDGKDMIVGFDVDLINAIGEKMDVEIELKDMAFDGIIAAVQTGKVDVACSGINATAERAEKVSFSDLYYEAKQVLLVREDSEEYKSMDQIKGKVVGSQLGSTSDNVISSFEGIEVKKFDNITDAVLDLSNERIDAVILEDPIAKTFVKDREGLKIVEPKGLKNDAMGVAIALPKGEDKLLEEVNAALKALKDSGELEKLVEKWLVK